MVDVSLSSSSRLLAWPLRRIQIGTFRAQPPHDPTDDNNDEKPQAFFDLEQKKIRVNLSHDKLHYTLETNFEQVQNARLHIASNQKEKLVLKLTRPPKILKQFDAQISESATPVFALDFTEGQASQADKHSLFFPEKSISTHLIDLNKAGLRVIVENMRTHTPMDVGQVHAALKKMRQPPTASPRLDAIILNDLVDKEIRERQARVNGICYVRNEIYTKAFSEVIKHVAKQEPRRGELLRCIRDEARMSIDVYRTVYEASLKFGSQKLEKASNKTHDLRQQIVDMDAEIQCLKGEVGSLQWLCESLQHRYEQSLKASEGKNDEIIRLEGEKAQLENLLEALRPVKQLQDQEKAAQEATQR